MIEQHLYLRMVSRNARSDTPGKSVFMSSIVSGA
jgi:hypothetical protein